MDYLKDCIDCKQDWSAGMDESCHNTCAKFLKWQKEGFDARGHIATQGIDDARAVS